MNLSICFIAPILELPFHQLRGDALECYIGDATKDKDWGEYLYLVLNKESEDFESKARNHKWFSELYKHGDKKIFRFSLPDDVKQNIVKPFIDGKYSEIDRAYVTKHFKEFEVIGYDPWGKPQVKHFVNYQVLTKSSKLRDFWEEKLGVSLPEDAEVWSRPERENEIFGYKTLVDERIHLETPISNHSNTGEENISGSNQVSGTSSDSGEEEKMGANDFGD